MGLELHIITITLLMFQLSHAQTRVGFYDGKCGSTNVEEIVFNTLQKRMNADITLAPRLVRLLFHDCFVRGCDASVLLGGTSSEQTAIPNLSLVPAFAVIDDAKAQLEALCPGVVSCADIIALAARDSVLLTQNQRGIFGKFKVQITYDVKTGRRDRSVSLASDTNNLPAPTDNVTTQIRKFEEKGLSIQDLVTLVGAHTIGAAQCGTFTYRLYNYSGTGQPDPSMSTGTLASLRSKCRADGSDATVRVPLDDSPTQFDNTYYFNIRDRQGVLESDQVLLNDPTSAGVVQRYYLLGSVLSGLDFKIEFGKSMGRMGDIGVLTGSNGEIRKVCSAPNS